MRITTFDRVSQLEPLIPQLACIYRDCFAEPPWHEVFAANEVEADLREALTKSSGVIVVAQEGTALIGAAVGYALAHRADMIDMLAVPERQFAYYYAELFVAATHRGVGVARRLIDARERFAIAQGFTSATVRTSVAQQIIQDIYLARGYSITARQQVMSDKVINNTLVRVPDERVIMHGKLILP